jgi:hypothetical protein
MSKMILFTILAVVVVLMIPLMLFPYVLGGEKLRPAGWLYFFLIGLAFMSVEVVLIQKYSLFIGASVYSIATVLLSLLIASGIGSRFAGRVPVGGAFFGILVWLLVEIFLLRYVTAGLAGLPMLVRAFTAGALVFPLGFFMGIPFPKGALRVGGLVDWGFAVNGVASVLGGTAIVLVSFTWGFTTALICTALCYALAWLVVSVNRIW